MKAFQHDELIYDVRRIDYDIRRIEYDFVTKTGRLFMDKDDDCDDPNGCIALFQRIDNRVRVVETYDGEVCNTV